MNNDKELVSNSPQLTGGVNGSLSRDWSRVVRRGTIRGCWTGGSQRAAFRPDKPPLSAWSTLLDNPFRTMASKGTLPAALFHDRLLLLYLTWIYLVRFEKKHLANCLIYVNWNPLDIRVKCCGIVLFITSLLPDRGNVMRGMIEK